MTQKRAFVFDAYGTLFDVHSIGTECNKIFPQKGEKISQTWRTKQVEYFMLHQIMGTYQPFKEITRSALLYAVKESHEELDSAAETQLMGAYLHLHIFPDVHRVLSELEGSTLAVFSNGSPDMLEPLVEQSIISHIVNQVISVDDVKQFKPSTQSYEYVLKTLNLSKDDIIFVSSNGWDISGAKNFGFQTAWINRDNNPVEELGLVPDHIFSNLNGLLSIN
ncbi:MAG: haloacid dehalogenase type II [Paenisporosarcina sp.]|nr:haloacid dehalogenase type II [Paenisporosarcina sp.]